MKRRLTILSLALVGVLSAGCSSESPPAPPVAPQVAAPPATAPQAAAPRPVAEPKDLFAPAPGQPAIPPGHPPIAGQPSPVTAAATHEGSVTAVQQAGGYSYIEVDSQGRRIWLASNPVQVAVGDRVRWGQSAVMRNFTSKSLGRTFEELVFVSSVSKADAAAAGPATGNRAKVVSLSQAGGYSFLELDTGGGTQWMAAQTAPVAVGDTVTWNGGMVMRNFTSQSLGRTFDQIIFVGAVGKAN